MQPLEDATLTRLSRCLHKLRHDLSNSLVAGLGEVELLAADAQSDPMAERLNLLRDRLLRPFQELRLLTAGLPHPAGAPTRWPELQQLFEQRARAQGTELAVQPEVLALLAALPALRPVLAALIANALDATDAFRQARIDVETASGRTTAGKHWQALTVRDTGPGCIDLAAAAAGQLQRAGSGHMGLGLAASAAILHRLSGELWLENGQAGGLVVCAIWPVSAPHGRS